jgi:spore coat polysaccharide biosynthesis protein SpsF
MRIVAVVQARCGSERLRDKVMARLGDRTVVEHCVAAIRAASLVDEVIVATTTSQVDDKLVALLDSVGTPSFRGSEDDVLGRFVCALESDSADVVLRHTADDPLLDPGVIDAVVGHFLKTGCDYASNMLHRSWPRGLDTEVMARETLERSAREGKRPEDREHVTIYPRTHPHLFRLHNVFALPQETWPELRLCVDTLEDARMLQCVFDALYEPGEILRIGAVVEYLRMHPEVAAMNAEVKQRVTLGRVF